MSAKPNKQAKAKKATFPVSPFALMLHGMDVTTSYLENNKKKG